MYVSKQVRYPWIISIHLFVEDVIFMDKCHTEIAFMKLRITRKILMLMMMACLDVYNEDDMDNEDLPEDDFK